MTSSAPSRPGYRPRVLHVLGALLLLFLLWSLATINFPSPRYGTASRTEPGAVMPRSTGQDADWSGNGGDPGGSQWSPLAQINAGNVGGLERAWTHRSGDLVPGGTGVGTRHEAIPLVVDNMLYTCTPFGRVIAMDAATGEERWRFDPFAAGAAGTPLFSSKMKPRHCRGVAYWRDAGAPAGAACAARIYRAAGEQAIIAVDAATGRPCEGFGAAAGHPGYVTHAEFDGRGEGKLSATSPPIVINGVLVAASAAGDGTVDSANGIVRGFDARTGDMLWEFDPIPAEHAHDTGAANIWTLLSGDPGRGLVFLATTSPSPDYFAGTRHFPIPYANAVVAVRVSDGSVAWHYQVVHRDLFDYDLPAQPMLVSIRKDGRLRDVVIQPTKAGLTFVLDRDTGQPVFPVREMPVPASLLPDEKAWPTQPVPVLPEHVSRTAITRDELFGLTPIDRQWCRQKFDSFRYEGMFTPPGPQQALTVPSSMGGANWGSASYDPVTNLLVVAANNQASTQGLRRKRPGEVVSGGFMTREIKGTDYLATGDFFLSPLGIPCMPPPWANLTAIDMNSGRIVWQVPLGQSKRWGITVPAFINWGSPIIGGPITTAGGLVFISAALDSRLRAFDIRTGRQLWQAPLPAPGMSVPASYAVGDQQYVAISAGGNAMMDTEISDSTVAFRLKP